MTKKRILWVAVGGFALVSALGAMALRGGDLEGSDPYESDGPVVMRPIPTATVQAAPGHCLRQFPGQVRASRRVELAFSVPGLLDRLNAEEGGRVQREGVLARLDQRDYQYALDRAQAAFENAERELDRCRNLREQKVATEVEYEDAETAYAIAQAELHVRQKALEDTVLLAPFDGIVVKRHVENHEHIQVGQTIVSFQDISHIEVVIQVPERLIAQGGPGVMEALQVRFDAHTDRWFEAGIREYRVTSDGVTQTYDVVVDLVRPPDLNVLPGMTAMVKARVAESSGASLSPEIATRIPVEALCCDTQGDSYVWIIDPAGGWPVKQRVETAGLQGDCIEVRRGLRPGQQVAVAGLHALHEGARVRPMASGKEGLDG